MDYILVSITLLVIKIKSRINFLRILFLTSVGIIYGFLFNVYNEVIFNELLIKYLKIEN